MYTEKVFSETTGFDWNYALLGSNPELSVVSILIHNAIAYVIAVYLIRKWSKKWNQNFTKSL